MQTDLLTVQPDDPIELVADLMSWERVRHVAVEDAKGMLVGLVTSRAVLRHFAGLAKSRASSEAPKSGAELDGVSVADIMRTELLTVTPDTLTVDAIAIMRKQRVGCLPVVQDGRIVAMITEEDFMGIAAEMLDRAHGHCHRPAARASEGQEAAMSTSAIRPVSPRASSPRSGASARSASRRGRAHAHRHRGHPRQRVRGAHRGASRVPPPRSAATCRCAASSSRSAATSPR